MAKKKDYAYTEKMNSLSIVGKNIEGLYKENFLDEVLYLDVERANIVNLDLKYFKNVTEITFGSKDEYKIPKELLKLKKLTKLIVAEKCLLPNDISKLKSLQHISLFNTGIFNVPKDIVKSKSIKSLDIYYYGKLKAVDAPKWLYEMIKLERLHFSVCSFKKISKKINQLVNLVDLDFGCSLSEIEKFPQLDGLTNLKRLVVSGENVQGQKKPPFTLFVQILEAIKNLKQLKELNISFWSPKNKSQWLVNRDGKHSIPDIFEEFPLLERLYIAGMKLDFLPSTIFSLSNLKEISILDNYLSAEEIKRLQIKFPQLIIYGDSFNKPRKNRKQETSTWKYYERQAEEAFAQGHDKEASEYYHKALEDIEEFEKASNFDKVWFYKNSAQAFAWNNETDLALDLINKSLIIKGNICNADELFVKGNIYLQLSEYEIAIELYRDALKAINKFYAKESDCKATGLIYSNKSLALRELGKNREAFELLKKAVTMQPRNADIWEEYMLTAKALGLAKDVERAIRKMQMLTK